MKKLFKYDTIDERYSIQPQESNQSFFTLCKAQCWRRAEVV